MRTDLSPHTALTWHRLKLEAIAACRKICCAKCGLIHQSPPKYGKCPCGNYTFTLDARPQLRLEFDR